LLLRWLQKWLAAIAEEKGVTIFPGFAGVQLLWDGDRVKGVQTGDKGVDRHGEPRDNFEPGINIEAKVTILGEGPRGTLTRQLINRKGLDKDSQPMVYEIGVKEVIEMPPGTVKKGEVILTLGYPLGLEDYRNDLDVRGVLALTDVQDPEVLALDERFRQLLRPTRGRIWESAPGNPFWDFGYPATAGPDLIADLTSEGLLEE